MPTVLDMYDLNNGRYVSDNLIFGAGKGKDMHWYSETGNNPRMKESFYTSDNLKAVSER